MHPLKCGLASEFATAAHCQMSHCLNVFNIPKENSLERVLTVMAAAATSGSKSVTEYC